MSNVNKVVYAGVVLLDLTEDTINEDVIIDGYTGHDKAGNIITGKLKIITVDEALDANSTNPVENKAIVAALNSYETKANAITGLSVSGRTITYTKGSGTTSTITTQDTTYTLPNATSSVLGGVKVGTNISVSSGTISVADGSTSAKGVVQLSSAVNSTSTSLAATASAVKSAYDLANGKQSPATTLAGYGITNAYTKTEVDTAISNNKYTLPTASTTLGGVKTTSTVTSTSGLTACPIISGVPYYKDTNNQYTLSSFSITATAAELNVLDGITATTAELNYCDGVTSNIQTQLNGKLGTSGTAARATADASGNNIANTYAKKATTLSGYGIPSVTWGQLKGS